MDQIHPTPVFVNSFTRHKLIHVFIAIATYAPHGRAVLGTKTIWPA